MRESDGVIGPSEEDFYEVRAEQYVEEYMRNLYDKRRRRGVLGLGTLEGVYGVLG